MGNRTVLIEIFKNSGLSESDLKRVVNSFDKIEFKKNDYVLKEGQISNEYYFVESGFMRSYAVDTEGNDITTGFYSPMQIVLEVSSFFLRIPTKENYQAITDCVCWKIGFEKFQELFHSILAFREAGRARLVNGYVGLKQRTLSIITDSAETRYLQLLKEHPEIIQQGPSKEYRDLFGNYGYFP